MIKLKSFNLTDFEFTYRVAVVAVVEVEVHYWEYAGRNSKKVASESYYLCRPTSVRKSGSFKDFVQDSFGNLVYLDVLDSTSCVVPPRIRSSIIPRLPGRTSSGLGRGGGAAALGVRDRRPQVGRLEDVGGLVVLLGAGDHRDCHAFRGWAAG